VTSTPCKATIDGSVAPGFERVYDAFYHNFTKRGEIGAACAIYRRGLKVVDLWGGYRDPKSRALWEAQTLAPALTATQGLAAMALAVLHSRGLLDYDEKVSTYWPEFAQAGKGAVTVRQLLAHEAGLCALDKRLNRARLGDLDALAVILARQKPMWLPGSRHGYHVNTLGLYMNELVRRIDAEHRSLSDFVHEDIAIPLELDIYIDLPPSVPDARYALPRTYGLWEVVRRLNSVPGRFVLALMTPGSLTRRALCYSKPAELNPRIATSFACGVGTARSIAKAYGALVDIGGAGARRLGLARETLAALSKAAPVSSDQVMGVDTAFSLGFLKPCPALRFGKDDSSFGMPGKGGALAFADPQAQIGFAYMPNRLMFGCLDDPRAAALRDALYRCLT
jgi:CubicO group peptidase (beta-lactamase class C family)